jgi:hypothetical protein
MMKTAIFAAVLCVGLASGGSAFADRWVEPVNGTVSAVMMPDGDVMMKIQLPAKEFQVVDRDMKANNDSCTIKEIYAGSPDTMILVCGTAGSKVQ